MSIARIPSAAPLLRIPQEEMALLKDAANSGDREAHTALGISYEKRGELKRAEHWYQLAARQNFAEAQYRLGLLRINGDIESNSELNFQDGVVELFVSAKRQAHIPASVCYANLYLSGTNIKADQIDKDFSLLAIYAKAAKEKYAPAFHGLGKYYEFGINDNKGHPDQAMKFYLKSAQQGYVPSMLKIAYYHAHKNDSKQAAYWFKQIADGPVDHFRWKLNLQGMIEYARRCKKEEKGKNFTRAAEFWLIQSKQAITLTNKDTDAEMQWFMEVVPYLNEQQSLCYELEIESDNVSALNDCFSLLAQFPPRGIKKLSLKIYQWELPLTYIESLRAMIKEFSSLTELSITVYEKLRERHEINLAEALEKITSLTSLQINVRNPSGRNSYLVFPDFIKQLNTRGNLTRLSLCDSFSEINTLLRSLPCDLQVLDLMQRPKQLKKSEQPQRLPDWRLMMTFLGRCQLQALSLDKIGLPDKNGMQWLLTLAKHPTLTRISIVNCDLSFEMQSYLVSNLAKNSVLTSLTLNSDGKVPHSILPYVDSPVLEHLSVDVGDFKMVQDLKRKMNDSQARTPLLRDLRFVMKSTEINISEAVEVVSKDEFEQLHFLPNTSQFFSSDRSQPLIEVLLKTKNLLNCSKGSQSNDHGEENDSYRKIHQHLQQNQTRHEHRLNSWMHICAVTAFVRNNFQHKYRLSILPFINFIVELTGNKHVEPVIAMQQFVRCRFFAKQVQPLLENSTSTLQCRP